MPASLIFPATCPACGKAANFIEFRMELCLTGEEIAPKGGWRGFRCMACGKRAKEIAAADGMHKWDGDKHVVGLA